MPKIHFSKKTDDWATPKLIYEQALEKGMYDPCPLGSLIDGLLIDWDESNFVNPPYSQLLKWVKKSIIEHTKGKSVILLIPARTDTKAFKLIFEYGAKITFITGRLYFNNSNPAPFPSMLVNLCGGGISNTKCDLVYREDIIL